MIKLNAQKRSKIDNVANLRKNGFVPAVVYGAGVENTPVSISAVDFKKVYKQAGETATIGLSIDGKEFPVLIHDIQVDPVRGFALHADFLVVDLKKELTASIPLEFVGVSEAVKSGAVLVKVLHEVEVSALPANIPQVLSVDISKLVTLEDNVYVSDIVLPANVSMVTELDEVVAAVTGAHEEVETAPLDLSSIEVEKKGKQEDEETA